MTDRRLLAAALPFAAGAVACRIVLTHAPAAVAADVQQPLPVVFGWRAFGLGVWAILAVTWVAAAWSADRLLRSESRPGAIAVVAAGAIAGALAWPIVASSDVYAYASFGLRAIAGHSPYGTLEGSSANAIDRAAIWQWGSTLPPDNYGPAFNVLAAGIVAASQANPAIALCAFRLAACSAFGACSVLLWFVVKREQAPAAIAFALNPLAVWTAAEGHNDFYALLAVLAGLLAARRVPAAGGALAALGALVKLPAIVAAVVAVRLAGPGRGRFAIGVAAGTAVAAAWCFPLFAAMAERAANPPPWPTAPLLYPWYAVWLLPLLSAYGATRRASLWASAATVVAYVPDVWGDGSLGARLAVSLVTFVLWALVLGRLLTRNGRPPPRDERPLESQAAAR